MTTNSDPMSAVQVGTLLIAPGTALPPEWRLETPSVIGGWSRLAVPLGRTVRSLVLDGLGWTLFFMASPITMTSAGFNRANMLEAAMAKLMAAVRLQKCNCVEIDRIGMGSFLGIPYASISAHPRHIQRGMVFSGQ